jgi:RNA 2',3'-cyclic 3'-phosphodiesterase
VRLFVALDIPEDVRAAIGALVKQLREQFRDARWVRIEGVHITLKFIGEVPSEKMEVIEAALRTVPSPAPIKINFRGLGFFPNERRPRVLWAGIESSAALGALAAAVDASLEPLGITREQRAFSPHLTLARYESSKGLDWLREGIAAAGPLEFGSGVAKEFHLYQSVLKRGGAEYTRLATFYWAASK